MEHKVFDNHLNLVIRVDMEGMEWGSKRAGNPKSLGLSETVPKAIDNLAMCKIGQGHDCFLKSCRVYVDWKLGKIVREHLIRYRFIDIVSGCSIMHRFKELKEAGEFPNNVETEDDIPYGFAYWISFTTNYLQLKTIYAQRRNHKRKEWQEFCDMLEQLPSAHWITGRRGANG